MKEKNTQAKTPNKKAIGLTTKIFIALIAGAILAIWFRTAVSKKM